MKISHILLVEDDDDQADLVTYVLGSAAPNLTLSRASNGAAALDYLYRRGEYIDSMPADLVLLDLKLPLVDGIGVLKDVKANDELRSIPVIMLTTSQADIDRDQAYTAGVNSYLVKPMEFDIMRDMINDILRYWGHWNNPVNTKMYST